MCCWPLPVQSFSGPSPLGLATVFYCLRFETSLFVPSYDSPGLFFSFVTFFYTDGRTPWTSDQPVARPLPTHRTTQTTQTSMPRVGFEPMIQGFELAKTVAHAHRANTIGPHFVLERLSLAAYSKCAGFKICITWIYELHFLVELHVPASSSPVVVVIKPKAEIIFLQLPTYYFTEEK
jgi:hypothetical protein